MPRERLPSLREIPESKSIPPPKNIEEAARLITSFKKELDDFQVYVVVQDRRYEALEKKYDEQTHAIEDVRRQILASNTNQTKILESIQIQIGNAPNKVLGTGGTGLVGTIASLVDIRDTSRAVIAGAAKWFAVAVAMLGGYKLLFEVWGHR